MKDVEISLCRCSVWIMTMPIRTLRNLDLYLAMDQIEIKAINVDYDVRVEYWILKNQVHVYKVYAIVKWMFDPNFVNNLWQTLGNNPCLAVGQTNKPQL